MGGPGRACAHPIIGCAHSVPSLEPQTDHSYTMAKRSRSVTLLDYFGSSGSSNVSGPKSAKVSDDTVTDVDDTAEASLAETDGDNILRSSTTCRSSNESLNDSNIISFTSSYSEQSQSSTSTSSSTSSSVPADIASSPEQSPVQPIISFPSETFGSKRRSFNSGILTD